MKTYEYDTVIYPATAFQELVYFCTADGQCREEPAPTNTTAKLTEVLNGRGREGWELIQLILSAKGIVTFWKRERD